MHTSDAPQAAGKPFNVSSNSFASQTVDGSKHGATIQHKRVAHQSGAMRRRYLNRTNPVRVLKPISLSHASTPRRLSLMTTYAREQWSREAPAPAPGTMALTDRRSLLLPWGHRGSVTPRYDETLLEANDLRLSLAFGRESDLAERADKHVLIEDL